MPVLEAMASGLACVATNCLGVQTFAQHGVNALLADTQVLLFPVPLSGVLPGAPSTGVDAPVQTNVLMPAAEPLAARRSGLPTPIWGRVCAHSCVVEITASKSSSLTV